MITYMLVTADGGKYVANSEEVRTYTDRHEDARKYRTRTDAIRDRRDGETVGGICVLEHAWA